MEIAFSPLSVCKSLVARTRSAYRLYVLAKGIAGVQDSVTVPEVEALACQYISERQFKRDKSAGARLGLFSIHERKSGSKVFVLASYDRAALLLGATKNSAHRRAAVSLDELFSDTWQAIAFVSWQSTTTRNGQLLMSQKKQAERTGIKPQMQRKYNKVCGVVSRSNYAVSNISANHLNAIREFGTRAAPFAFKNYKTNQSYIAWRLPSTRRVVCADSSAVNDFVDGSLISTNPNANRKGGSNLFVYAEASYTKALSRCKQDQPDLYMFSHISQSGAGLFVHFAI